MVRQYYSSPQPCKYKWLTSRHCIIFFSFGRYVWFWQGQHGNVPGTETGDDADADVKPPATGLEVGCCGYKMCSRCED